MSGFLFNYLGDPGDDGDSFDMDQDEETQDQHDGLVGEDMEEDDGDYSPTDDDEDDDGDFELAFDGEDFEDDDQDNGENPEGTVYVMDADDATSDEEETGGIGNDGSSLFELLSLFNSGPARLSPESRAHLLNRLILSAGSDSSYPRYSPAQSAAERAASRRRTRWWKPQTEPHPNGTALLRSGDFGPTGPWRAQGQHRSRPSERYGWRSARARAAARPTVHPAIPNTPGTVVAEYPTVPYVGQFCGPDYGVFYSATQDFTLYLYNTTAPKNEKWRRVRGGGTRIITGGNPGVLESDQETDDDDVEEYWGRTRWSRGPNQATSMDKIKAVRGVPGQWTITDADADRPGKRMLYSSITPLVHMLHTAEHDTEHVTLDFRGRDHDHFGIWSIRFSADGKEVVAGASSGAIMVYDVEAERRILSVSGHNDDVNAVCFADESSTNILVSGSDDGYVKVWDRRSLSSSIPSGVLAGATEGITYTSPKGDGRYLVVNSKDQAARLYDLRKMRSWSEFDYEPDAVSRWGQPHFDYRGDRYRPPKRLAHPRDCSVMTYRGHSVLRTLIRCHFSPVESTGQSYIYSGSADGLIHIWSLDGRVVQVLNRAESIPLRNARGGFNDPSAAEPTNRRHRIGADAYEMSERNWIVRDVAWHGYEPTLMSTCWEVAGRYRNGGSVAKHEWKGLGKGGLRYLEDWVEKTAQEADEATR